MTLWVDASLNIKSSSSSSSVWETSRYRLKYCLKGPLNPKQLTNQRTTRPPPCMTARYRLKFCLKRKLTGQETLKSNMTARYRLKFCLKRKLTGQETLKSMAILFIKDGIDFYPSRCMSDNIMALALTVPKKHD